MSGTRIAPWAAAAAALALLLVLACASGPPRGGPAKAEAADCVPVQHSKRHVHKKKVRRHGKLVTRRKKHIHRWTTCEPPPFACAEPASNLGVTARDATGSSFTLSRSCVTAGEVTVQLNNQGEDPHNVFLRPVAGPDPGYSIPADSPYELGPLSQDEGTFKLTAGEWYLWCSLLLHEEQGMIAHLTVR